MSHQEANKIVFLKDREATLQSTLELMRQCEISELDVARAELSSFAIRFIVQFKKR